MLAGRPDPMEEIWNERERTSARLPLLLVCGVCVRTSSEERERERTELNMRRSCHPRLRTCLCGVAAAAAAAAAAEYSLPRPNDRYTALTQDSSRETERDTHALMSPIRFMDRETEERMPRVRWLSLFLSSLLSRSEWVDRRVASFTQSSPSFHSRTTLSLFIPLAASFVTSLFRFPSVCLSVSLSPSVSLPVVPSVLRSDVLLVARSIAASKGSQ